MVIETDRLILRKFTENDFDALYKVLGDAENMKHYPAPFDQERVKGWINKNIDRYSTFGFGLWAVVLKETGEVIGDCGLTMQVINGEIKPEIGYHIRRDMQKNGYATEAAAAVRNWVFLNTPFNEVYSYMTSSNEPSAKTAMAYGCKKADSYTDDAGIDIDIYRITRLEWVQLYLIFED